jgi:biotin carboxyl carrier protein
MRRYSVKVGGQTTVVGLEPTAGGLRVVVGERERLLEVREAAGLLSWLDGNRVVSAQVQNVDGAAAAGTSGAGAPGREVRLMVTTGGQVLPAEVSDAAVEGVAARAAQGRVSTGPISLRAPMPGRVVKLLARAGDQLKAGQGVLVVEAMKMENEIKVPRDGRLREMRAVEGAAVDAGEELAVLE